MKPNLKMPAATQMRPVMIESIPASAIARAGSPAASGSTTAAMIPASEESGPRTRMRLGPKRA